MHNPPKAAVCTPGNLFRVLSSPLPRWPVTYRPPGLERFRLEARGLSACEAEHLFDEVERLTRDRRRTALTLELLALALLADGRRAFDNADQVATLPSHVVDGLSIGLADALAVCSPLYGRSNGTAWAATLKAGAREHQHIAVVLGGCADEGQMRNAPRPDRYFGKPLVELTDGQWMAYRAATSFLHDITPKPKTATRRR